MTFVEAAIEILKREGKPMSTRRLAELAVKLNLLSVVGRDPEATMQQRLDDALGRAARHPDLVRLKADTFGLHAYPDKPSASERQRHARGGAGRSVGGRRGGAGGEAGGEPKKGGVAVAVADVAAARKARPARGRRATSERGR